MTRAYPELLAGWAKDSMLGRVGEVEDIAGPCIFLASDASRNINAHELIIDGGTTRW